MDGESKSVGFEGSSDRYVLSTKHHRSRQVKFQQKRRAAGRVCETCLTVRRNTGFEPYETGELRTKFGCSDKYC